MHSRSVCCVRFVYMFTLQAVCSFYDGGSSMCIHSTHVVVYVISAAKANVVNENCNLERTSFNNCNY